VTEKRIIAVEIGGTKLQAAIGTPEGKILRAERGRVNPEKGAAGILDWVTARVEELVAACGGAASAIGVGFGGPVESATGAVLVSHQIAGWEGVALKTLLEGRFSLPVVVANDANAAGWAEYRLGAGRGARQFFYMNIGSGIGGALVVDGKLHDGQGRGAGEIGHTWVPDWTADAPGRADKLENLCSGWSIERRIRGWADLDPATSLGHCCGGDPARLTCALLADAARQGDPRALEEIHRVAQTAALALANVVTLFHPEVIALGGGVSLMGDVLLNPLTEALDTRAFGPYRGRYRLTPCQLEEDVVVVGALLLAGEC